MPKTALRDIKTIIWDLDNTLYPYTEEQIEHWHEATVRAAIDLGAPITLEAGLHQARQSFAEHNYSSKIFVDTYGLCPRKMHAGLHPYSNEKILPVCMLTQESFEALPNVRHVVLTHAHRNWAERVLRHLGLRDFFEDDLIMGLEDYGYEEKHASNRGILQSLDQTGCNPEHALFAEDTLRNLERAKATGIQTAYVHHGVTGDNDNRPPFVDHVFLNAADVMMTLSKQKQV